MPRRQELLYSSTLPIGIEGFAKASWGIPCLPSPKTGSIYGFQMPGEKNWR